MMELDINDLIKRYEAGASPQELAEHFGVGHSTIRDRLRKSGVKMRDVSQARTISSEKRRVIEDDAIIQTRYYAGESVNALAKSLGVSRQAVMNSLSRSNTIMRDQSTAEAFKWARMSKRSRKRQVAAAHDAVRGSTQTDTHKARLALSRFRNQSQVYIGEDRIAAFIELAGYATSQQFPCGPYNLDIVIEEHRIAVEVVHLSATDFNRPKTAVPGCERLEYILRDGWFVLYLIATGTGSNRSIDLAVIGDELLATLKIASRDNAFRGKYRVIWGKGKAPPRARYDFGQNASI